MDKWGIESEYNIFKEDFDMRVSNMIMLVGFFLFIGGGLIATYGIYNLGIGLDVEFINYTGVTERNIDAKQYSSYPQFMINTRFPSNHITWMMADGCSQSQRESVVEAFDIVAEGSVLEFEELYSGAQINVTCGDYVEDVNDTYEGVGEVVGEGGPRNISVTPFVSLVHAGVIRLYDDEKCDYPATAIHELFHVLGFDHVDDKKNILYPLLDCEQRINDEQFKDINSLYSMPEKPDLYIKNITVGKSGRYINYRVVASNQGLVESIKYAVEITYVQVNGDEETELIFFPVTYPGESYIRTIEFEKIHKDVVGIYFDVIPEKGEEIFNESKQWFVNLTKEAALD